MIVHNKGVVIKDKLLCDLLVFGLVDNESVYLRVTVILVSLFLKVVILFNQFIAAREGSFTSQLTAEVSVFAPDYDLNVLICVVLKAVIHIVIANRGSCTKGDLSSFVGEESIRMVMKLCYGKGAVKHQPMDHIRHLAKSAAIALGESVFTDDQTLLVALSLSRLAEGTPEGEGLAGLNNDITDLIAGKLYVGDLIFLQGNIHVMQFSYQHRGMTLNDIGQYIIALPFSDLFLAENIFNMSLGDLLLY